MNLKLQHHVVFVELTYQELLFSLSSGRSGGFWLCAGQESEVESSLSEGKQTLVDHPHAEPRYQAERFLFPSDF